jgi:predicted outer membrane lipoprotein
MWYFSWTPAIGIIDAMRLDANGHDEVARRGNTGKRRS